MYITSYCLSLFPQCFAGTKLPAMRFRIQEKAASAVILLSTRYDGSVTERSLVACWCARYRQLPGRYICRQTFFAFPTAAHSVLKIIAGAHPWGGGQDRPEAESALDPGQDSRVDLEDARASQPHQVSSVLLSEIWVPPVSRWDCTWNKGDRGFSRGAAKDARCQALPLLVALPDWFSSSFAIRQRECALQRARSS